jgi:hypothetical protein
MPKFRITSRGGTTLTKIPAALKARYVGYATGDPKKKLSFDVVSKASFKDGILEIPEWYPIGKVTDLLPPVGVLTSLEVEADIPSDVSFYETTILTFKLKLVQTKVPGKDGKVEIVYSVEGLPQSVSIPLTEIPRSKEDIAKRREAIKSEAATAASGKRSKRGVEEPK